MKAGVDLAAVILYSLYWTIPMSSGTAEEYMLKMEVSKDLDMSAPKLDGCNYAKHSELTQNQRKEILCLN